MRSIEPDGMPLVEIDACRKDDAPLSLADEDVAVCALGKVEPIGVVERAAA